MSRRWCAVLLLAFPSAHGADLLFLNGDGGPLPAYLAPVAAAFSSPEGDLSDDANRAALAEAIVRWANAHDHPVFYASVEAPDRRGVVTVLLKDGKAGNITIEGGAHLPAERLLRSLRITSGEPLNGRRLQEELDWLQRNPFHEASLAASPGATADVADLAFKLTDDRPVRFLLGCDNQGVEPLGQSRTRAAFQWGNAFGLDQQIALQAMSGDDVDAYRSLAGEWVIPLAWRHELRVAAAWAATEFKDESQSPPVDTEGGLWAVSLRYVIPFRLTNTQTAEVFAGFDYRKFDNDYAFGGTSSFASAVEVGAFLLGAGWKKTTAARTDSASLELVWSPGGMFADGDDAAYEAINPEAEARCFLVRGAWQSRRRIAGGWTWVNRAGGQAASAPLLPSEDYNIAGASAVRGYPERRVRGRHAAFLSTEILTPALPVPAAWRGAGAAWQLAAFADGGWAYSSTEEPESWLASAGLGVRAVAGRSFTLTADVAWPLHDVQEDSGPRLHVAAQLQF
jgi:hemolysin activation/secretion protein